MAGLDTKTDLDRLRRRVESCDAALTQVIDRNASVEEICAAYRDLIRAQEEVYIAQRTQKRR